MNDISGSVRAYSTVYPNESMATCIECDLDPGVSADESLNAGSEPICEEKTS